MTCENVCPVCFFNMPYPNDVDEICPCCGTQFGHDDMAKTEAGRKHRRDELRLRWIENGQPFWFARYRPAGWNPATQTGGRISFGFAPEATGHYTITRLDGFPLDEPGLYKIEIAIRTTGSDAEWVNCNSHPFRVNHRVASEHMQP